MKPVQCLLIALLFSGTIFAQKVNYKSNIINVDGKDIAKVTKIKDKENWGLTSSYELLTLDDKKLVIATVATDFSPTAGDNSGLFYRFSFLNTSQIAIFKLNTLGTEKSFAKLIGESGIVTDGQLNDEKVKELIARKGRNPKVDVDNYDLIERNIMMAVYIKENMVYQGMANIGQFKDVSTKPDFDTYEFSLPSGLIVAKVSFTGGNGAQNCSMTTFKDQIVRNVDLSRNGTFGKSILKSETVDRNQEILKVIAKWLVDKRYL